MTLSGMVRSIGLALVATIILAAAPAQAEWRRAESQHFIVYGDVGEGTLRDYVRKVERFDGVLRTWFPVPQDGATPKLEIFLAHGLDELRAINPDTRSGVGGFYSAGDSRVFAVVDLSKGEGDHTLFHEYAHHFMLAHMAGAYPGWFIEGFAEFFATADLSRGRARVGLPSEGRLYSLQQSGAWVPMEAVLGSRSSQLSKDQAPGYYAQSWALTSYLLSTPERRVLLARYLSAVMGGAEPVAALAGTIDRTPQQLQGDVRRYIGRINYSTEQREYTPAEVEITTLPRSTRDLIWLDLRMSQSLDEDQQAEALARARDFAERYPGDRLAAVVLAKAELKNENWPAAEAALEPFIAASAPDPEALWLTASAQMRRADAADTPSEDRDLLYAQAQGLLVRAIRVNPTDFRFYMSLADNRQVSPGYPTDQDLEILLAAATYAPQVTTTRYRAAYALVDQGIYLQAIELLAPIANNPHGGAGMQPVRDLLAEARAKAGVADNAAELPADLGEEAAAEE